MATDRTERLLNLVLCLLGSRRPVPRAALQASVPGYADAASQEAFERMFERDKDELRSMGIPVETIVNAAGEVEGYLIDAAAYGIPDIHLDAAEMAVVGLAARAWSDAALGAQVTAALRKIEATTGERVDAPPLLISRPAAGEEHLPLLWEAIRSRHAVRFDYLALGREASETRTIEPWATVSWNSAWYAVGFSRERREPRAFRLSRVQGTVSLLADVFDPVAHEDVSALVRALAEPPSAGVAHVVPPQHGAARLRARARERDDGTWDVDFPDGDVLLMEVLEAGAIILEPADLARQQAEALARVRDLHGRERDRPAHG